MAKQTFWTNGDIRNQKPITSTGIVDMSIVMSPFLVQLISLDSSLIFIKNNFDSYYKISRPFSLSIAQIEMCYNLGTFKVIAVSGIKLLDS